MKFDNKERESFFLKVMQENMDNYNAEGAVKKVLSVILSGILFERKLFLSHWEKDCHTLKAFKETYLKKRLEKPL